MTMIFVVLTVNTLFIMIIKIVRLRLDELWLSTGCSNDKSNADDFGDCVGCGCYCSRQQPTNWRCLLCWGWQLDKYDNFSKGVAEDVCEYSWTRQTVFVCWSKDDDDIGREHNDNDAFIKSLSLTNSYCVFVWGWYDVGGGGDEVISMNYSVGNIWW